VWRRDPRSLFCRGGGGSLLGFNMVLQIMAPAGARGQRPWPFFRQAPAGRQSRCRRISPNTPMPSSANEAGSVTEVEAGAENFPIVVARRRNDRARPKKLKISNSVPAASANPSPDVSSNVPAGDHPLRNGEGASTTALIPCSMGSASSIQSAVHCSRHRRQPRPIYGIFVAITVMNWTFASSDRLAI
jgi:hypothetical protein